MTSVSVLCPKCAHQLQAVDLRKQKNTARGNLFEDFKQTHRDVAASRTLGRRWISWSCSRLPGKVGPRTLDTAAQPFTMVADCGGADVALQQLH